jgi:hypothetical protein
MLRGWRLAAVSGESTFLPAVLARLVGVSAAFAIDKDGCPA